jgi:hypothetical protein
MSVFVGTSDRLLTASELKELLEKLAIKPSYYFLRWFHQVSGFISQLPEYFPSPEGQMFNSELELRWKQKGEHFSVLLLSTTGEKPGFTPIGEAWEVQQRNAHVYPATETRFPKRIEAGKVNINQRYFLNPQTATIHFVALTVSDSPSNT